MSAFGVKRTSVAPSDPKRTFCPRIVAVQKVTVSTINLARHDKIVLVQPLDLLGAQRDGRVTPAEADIGVMTLGFSQVTDVANKAERFLKVTEAESSFDTAPIIA